MSPAESVTLPLDQFEALLSRAAEEGARRALERVGLHDQDAARDITALRGLLDAWRDVRSEGLRTITKAITVAVLAGLAAWVGIRPHLGD